MTVASVHPGLKIIPTCVISISDLENRLVATHALLVDTDGSQLFAKVCASGPDPNGGFNWCAWVDYQRDPTFPLPGKQKSISRQWPCLRSRSQN